MIMTAVLVAFPTLLGEPSFSMHDADNGGSANLRIQSSYRSYRHTAFSEVANFVRIFLCQLCASMIFTGRMSCLPTSLRILHIIGGRAPVQVFWVAAWRIVTLMQRLKLWALSPWIVERQSEPVRQPRLSSERKLSISVAIPMTVPRPTRFGFCDTFPKAATRRCKRKLSISAPSFFHGGMLPFLFSESRENNS